MGDTHPLMLIARRLGTLKDVAWVGAWSYRITSREAHRSLRRARRRRTEQLDDAAEMVPNAEEHAPVGSRNPEASCG